MPGSRPLISHTDKYRVSSSCISEPDSGTAVVTSANPIALGGVSPLLTTDRSVLCTAYAHHSPCSCPPRLLAVDSHAGGNQQPEDGEGKNRGSDENKQYKVRT